MLSLKRKEGEGLLLTTPDGQRIEIYFDRVRGGSLAAKTKAPRSILVERIDSHGNIQGRKSEQYSKSN
jgi:sRNA-binding carbon storage regulator CsrA